MALVVCSCQSAPVGHRLIMAKRKKQRKSRHPQQRSSRRLIRDLASAMELFEEGDATTAQNKLLQLLVKYPRSKLVLQALQDVCAELQDWRTLAIYSEKLLSLERGEDRAATLNNLLVAHQQLFYPALAWKYAHELETKYSYFAPIEQAESYV